MKLQCFTLASFAVSKAAGFGYMHEDDDWKCANYGTAASCAEWAATCELIVAVMAAVRSASARGGGSSKEEEGLASKPVLLAIRHGSGIC